MINNFFIGFFELLSILIEKSDKEKAKIASVLTGLVLGLLLTFFCSYISVFVINIKGLIWLNAVSIVLSIVICYHYYIRKNKYVELQVSEGLYDTARGIVGITLITVAIVIIILSVF